MYNKNEHVQEQYALLNHQQPFVKEIMMTFDPQAHPTGIYSLEVQCTDLLGHDEDRM